MNEIKKEIGTVPPGGYRNTIRPHMSDFENKSMELLPATSSILVL